MNRQRGARTRTSLYARGRLRVTVLTGLISLVTLLSLGTLMPPPPRRLRSPTPVSAATARTYLAC